MPLASSAIGVTSTCPVAGSSGGQLWLSNVAGSTYLVPYYAGLTSTEPWRASITVPMISPTSVAYSYTTTAAYVQAIANSGMYLDFTRFRQARIVLWGAIQIVSTNATVKIVDTTNTQDITGTVTLNSITPSRKFSTWASLNSATYAGDAEFEIQAREITGADVIKLYSVQLELR